LLTHNNRRLGGHATDHVPVLETGFQLDSLVNTYTIAHMYNEFRLAQNSPCAGPSGTLVRRGVFVPLLTSTRFGSERASRKVRKILDGLELNVIHQLLVYGLYIYWVTIQIQYRKIQKLYNRDRY
jgi:hypothetical protein